MSNKRQQWKSAHSAAIKSIRDLRTILGTLEMRIKASKENPSAFMPSGRLRGLSGITAFCRATSKGLRELEETAYSLWNRSVSISQVKAKPDFPERNIKVKGTKIKCRPNRQKEKMEEKLTRPKSKPAKRNPAKKKSKP